jgi:two-component system OmpR family response regulator
MPWTMSLMTVRPPWPSSRPERFDLVILDLNLPGMDGIDVLRTIRTPRSRPGVLILSARGASDDRVRGLDLGADDYMIKPFDVDELEARVRMLLRRQTGLRSTTISLAGLTSTSTRAVFSAHGNARFACPRTSACWKLCSCAPAKVVTKQAIIESLASFDDELSANAIEQYVSRLRRASHATWADRANRARHRLLSRSRETGMKRPRGPYSLRRRLLAWLLAPTGRDRARCAGRFLQRSG